MDVEEERAAVEIEINKSFCRRCGECVESCPQSGERELPVLEGGAGEVARVAHPENCIACLTCTATCRARAVKVGGVKRPPMAVQDEEAAAKSKGLY